MLADHKNKRSTNIRRLSRQPAERYRCIVSPDFRTLRKRDKQLIFLGSVKLSQIDSYDFSPDGWCEMLNLLRSTEQCSLLRISQVPTIGDVNFLERLPTDDGKVWLKRIFVLLPRLDAILRTL